MSINKTRNLLSNIWKGTFSRFLILLLNFLFIFNLFFAGNQSGSIINEIHYASLHSHTGSFIHHKINLVFESMSETEEDFEAELDALDFNARFTDFILSPAISLSDKMLSALPSPFIQTKYSVPLFILFHSWKNFLPS